jgi:glycosyltransferase involved in cell wall biosynthesis
MTVSFLFIDSLVNHKWNGLLLREKEGVSGTTISSVFLAEGLAKKGFICDFISISDNIDECNYLGVNYIKQKNLKKNYAFIVISWHLKDLEIFNITQIYFFKIFVIMGNHLAPETPAVFESQRQNIIILWISEFSKINILKEQPYLSLHPNFMLHNSIDLNDLVEIKQKKNNNIVFFASPERGLKMVSLLIKSFPSLQLITNNYNQQKLDYLENNDQVFYTTNTSKKTILSVLARSKYFVYPVFNIDNNVVHYDCGPYVILEALLEGCIVIAPRMALFEELYGDAIFYVNSDGIIPKEYLEKSNYFVKHNEFGYPMMERYKTAIQTLESSENLRNIYITKGVSIKERYCNQRTTDKFTHIICSIMTT